MPTVSLFFERCCIAPIGKYVMTDASLAVFSVIDTGSFSETPFLDYKLHNKRSHYPIWNATFFVLIYVLPFRHLNQKPSLAQLEGVFVRMVVVYPYTFF